MYLNRCILTIMIHSCYREYIPCMVNDMATVANVAKILNMLRNEDVYKLVQVLLFERTNKTTSLVR